ncbi:MAG: potassium transporter TrkA [Symploca sp. SIO2E6]|nr:potassium transporter TrkA [Symploca sp. SIO2E6]
MDKKVNFQEPIDYSQIGLDRFLVCGLGSLGQHCVTVLKEFGVKVIGIEQEQPQFWEIPNLPNFLDELIISDCRQTGVLEKAQIQHCRAVLLVTSNEQVNAQTALAVRKLNPQTRLVVRSAKGNLNRLLSKHLGNFVAFEPTQLPAAAFALAALGTETLGFFNLEGEWLRVVKHEVAESDRWCNQRLVHQLNNRNRRILCHTYNGSQFLESFHQWEPDAVIQAEDILVYIETADQFLINQTKKLATDYRITRQQRWERWRRCLTRPNFKQQLIQFWQQRFRQQVRQVAIVCGLMVLVLLLTGTVLFKWHYPETTWLSSFYATAILLLGGYADLFGEFRITTPIPWWLQLFSLGLTLAGTAFVGVLYALLTEALLAYKFQLSLRRPPVPQRDHVVIIGLGRVGQRVAALLRAFQQSLVGITLNPDFDRTTLPQMPLIFDALNAGALAKANLSTAKSVFVGTDDEMLNLEIALMARGINPHSHIVIRTFGQGLSDNLAGLLPNAQIICAYEVAAEAFAGAAFGENIISLFRLDNQTVLVTEYQVEADDTLNGLLLAEISYGYGVVIIMHQRGDEMPRFMPSDDLRLAVDDHMVVLATIDGLRRIEQGKIAITPKRWRVTVEKALTQVAIFEGANAIARVSGCSLATARRLMNNLPKTLRLPLYKQQAQRLVRKLSKVQVIAQMVRIGEN